jgi:hypothetical protein
VKPEELARFSKKVWLIQYVDMPARQLTIEIARRRAAQWYQLRSGRYLLCKDHGEYFVPGATRMPWPDQPLADYLLDEFPDWGNDTNAAIQLALELREQYGDPHRLLLETDEQGRRRWLAMFRKCHAYAWGDTPSEAMCRAYLLAYEYFND